MQNSTTNALKYGKVALIKKQKETAAKYVDLENIKERIPNVKSSELSEENSDRQSKFELDALKMVSRLSAFVKVSPMGCFRWFYKG